MQKYITSVVNAQVFAVLLLPLYTLHNNRDIQVTII